MNTRNRRSSTLPVLGVVAIGLLCGAFAWSAQALPATGSSSLPGHGSGADELGLAMIAMIAAFFIARFFIEPAAERVEETNR
jgi:hypothetical protein